MNKRKLLSLALLFILSLSLLTACSDKTLYIDPAAGDKAETIKVTVTVVDADGIDLLKKDVKIKSDAPTAAMATAWALKDSGVTYSEKDGFYNDFGGIPSVDTDGWLLYINDELAAEGANTQKIADGDTVSWQYRSFEAIFGT